MLKASRSTGEASPACCVSHRRRLGHDKSTQRNYTLHGTPVKRLQADLKAASQIRSVNTANDMDTIAACAEHTTRVDGFGSPAQGTSSTDLLKQDCEHFLGLSMYVGWWRSGYTRSAKQTGSSLTDATCSGALFRGCGTLFLLWIEMNQESR